MVPNSVSKLELMQARITFIPKGWFLSSIGKSYQICNNLRKPISESERISKPGPYPYYGPTKIQGYIATYEQNDDVVTIGEDGDHFLKFRSQPMTMLISGKCTVNNHAHIIKGTNKSSREWFYYYFMHRDIFSFLSRQGAGRFKLNKASLEKIPVLIPPLPEQKKIAEILSTWDKAICTTEKLLANSQQQKKALMQQLLTGKKRFPGFATNFKRYHFSELLKIDAINLSSKTSNNYEFNYISLSDVGPGHINSDLARHSFKSAPSRARRVINKGDILLSTVRPNLQGFAKVEAKHKDCIASTGFAVLTPIKETCGDYIYHYLFSAHITGQINALVVGTNYPAINSSDVSGLCIYSPGYKEQVFIANILNHCDRTIKNIKSNLNGLKQEKRALMQQLLTGKRRVKVNQQEAADVNI